MAENNETPNVVTIDKKSLYWIFGILAVVVLGIGYFAYTNMNAGPGPGDKVDVIIDDDPFLGNENAPVIMVEYSDFECPFCAAYFAQTYPQIKEKYIDTGKVKYVFKDFPLVSLHPQAMPAALAAECADDQGAFWEYHDSLFGLRTQNVELNETLYFDIANALGLDVTEFTRCVNEGDHFYEVDIDVGQGRGNGVSGTPAFFINGKLISGAQPFSVFEQAIEAEL